MKYLTFLSTADDVRLAATTPSVFSLQNCAVTIIGGSVNSLKTRRLTDRLVVQVQKTGFAGSIPRILVTATNASIPVRSNLATGLFGVRIETAVVLNTLQERLTFESQVSAVIVDRCTTPQHVMFGHTGNGLNIGQIVISLPPRGTGPDTLDISIGRFWSADSAIVAAALGVDPSWSYDAHAPFGESRRFQVYASNVADTAIRQRSRFSLTRVTEQEYSIPAIGYDMRVESFLQRSAGSETVIFRGQRYQTSNSWISTLADRQPLKLAKTRIERADVSQTAGLYSVDLETVEEL